MNSRGEIRETTLGALLPGRFDSANLGVGPEREAGDPVPGAKPAISPKRG